MLHKLIKFELIINSRSHHLLRSAAYTILLSAFIFELVIPDQISSGSSRILSCFCGIILTTLVIPHYLIKQDVQDGSLETMLVETSATNILLAKYIALFLTIVSSIIITLPFTTLFFSCGIWPSAYLLMLGILAVAQISALVLFANIVHAYFRRNTNFVIALILPLIIPTLIIGSIGLDTLKIDFIMILLGIDMIIVPIVFWLSTYLLRNLYNF